MQLRCVCLLLQVLLLCFSSVFGFFRCHTGQDKNRCECVEDSVITSEHVASKMFTTSKPCYGALQKQLEADASRLLQTIKKGGFHLPPKCLQQLRGMPHIMLLLVERVPAMVVSGRGILEASSQPSRVNPFDQFASDLADLSSDLVPFGFHMITECRAALKPIADLESEKKQELLEAFEGSALQAVTVVLDFWHRQLQELIQDIPQEEDEREVNEEVLVKSSIRKVDTHSKHKSLHMHTAPWTQTVLTTGLLELHSAMSTGEGGTKASRSILGAVAQVTMAIVDVATLGSSLAVTVPIRVGLAVGDGVADVVEGEHVASVVGEAAVTHVAEHAVSAVVSEAAPFVGSAVLAVRQAVSNSEREEDIQRRIREKETAKEKYLTSLHHGCSLMKKEDGSLRAGFEVCCSCDFNEKTGEVDDGLCSVLQNPCSEHKVDTILFTGPFCRCTDVHSKMGAVTFSFNTIAHYAAQLRLGITRQELRQRMKPGLVIV